MSAAAGSPKRSKRTHEHGAVFRALADDHRRVMLTMLSKRPHTATELGAPFDSSAPAISQHLALLRQAGLVEVEKVGKYRVYKLATAPLAETAAWLLELEHSARDTPERLEALLRRLEKEAARAR